MAMQGQASTSGRHSTALVLWVAVAAAVIALLALVTTRRPAPAGPAMALRASEDVSANTSSFTYTPGSPGIATSGRMFHRGDPGVLTLNVYGLPPQPGAPGAIVYADLYNGLATRVTFPGNATIEVTILRNGQPFKQVSLNSPATASLDPGKLAHLETTVPLDAAGTYTLSGQVVSAIQK